MTPSNTPAPIQPPPRQDANRHVRRRRGHRLLSILLSILLLLSVLWNFVQYRQNRSYFGGSALPTERFHSGDLAASDRVALLRISGTISPPFTGRLVRQIQRARQDPAVRGAILVVDSPGGLVADSHEIYHELKKLSAAKPLYVQMRRIAASGGYYIAMGAGPEGRIFAEPTTWTGSIGVIIPRYNAAELAKRIGVSVEPLTTGRFKDTLSPFRDLTEEERTLWGEIIDDAYQRFVGVIAENRSQLDAESLAPLATGRIFTATQARDSGLIDEIGFLDDCIAALQEQLGLNSVRVVTYYSQPSLLESLVGLSAAQRTSDPLTTLMEASVPRALYLCSWAPLVPATETSED